MEPKDIIARYMELARKYIPATVEDIKERNNFILRLIADEENLNIVYVQDVFKKFIKQSHEYRFKSDKMPAWEEWNDVNARHIKELETVLTDWTQEKINAIESGDFVHATEAQDEIDMLTNYISYIKKHNFEESQ